jgi:prophage antirepressor-like protein
MSKKIEKKPEPIIFGKSKIRTSNKGDLCLIDIIDASSNKTNKKEIQKFCKEKTYEEDGNVYITPDTVGNILKEYNSNKAKELLKHLEDENIIKADKKKEKKVVTKKVIKKKKESDSDSSSESSSDSDSESEKNTKCKSINKKLDLKKNNVENKNTQKKNEKIVPHKFSNILEYSNKSFDYIVKKINGEFKPFFKGMDVAGFFGYSDTDKAIRKHVDSEEKFELIDLVLPADLAGMTYKEKTAIYITEAGIYSLVWKSQKPEAKAFKKFVETELLPTLRKTGSYSFKNVSPKINQFIRDTSQIENFYNKNNIITFFNANVFYLIVIGMVDGFYVIKFGHSMRIFERDYKEHKATYGEQTKVIFVAETDNNILVETQFKKFLETKNALVEMEFGSKNRTELFKTSPNLSIEDTIKAIEMLIEKNPSNAEKKIKEYNKYELSLSTKLEIAKEKTKQKELDNERKIKLAQEKTKQEEEKTKQKDADARKEEAIAKQEEEKRKQMELESKKQKEDKEIKNIQEKSDKSEENEVTNTENEVTNTENDMYLQFLNENLEKTENEKDKILCTTLYETYKIWFKNNNPNAKIPSSKEFNKCTKKYITIKNKIRIGDKTQAGIEGYKFCEND